MLKSMIILNTLVFLVAACSPNHHLVEPYETERLISNSESVSQDPRAADAVTDHLNRRNVKDDVSLTALFASFCVATLGSADLVTAELAKSGWQQLTSDQADAYIQGVRPAARAAFGNPNIKGVTILIGYSGNITHKARVESRNKGVPTESQLIDQAKMREDPLGTLLSDVIGMKHCSIFETKLSAEDLIPKINLIEIQGERLGQAIVQNVQQGADPMDECGRTLDVWDASSGGRVNLRRVHSGTRCLFQTNLAFSKFVFVDDPPQSYQLE